MEGSIFWHCCILSLIIAFLLASPAMATHSIISDKDALLALKDHITFDPNQTLAKNWSVTSPICEWTGVTCGKRHKTRVTVLDISGMGLTGTIAPHLGNLSFLVSLNLSRNNFHGDIPHELGQLRRLKWLKINANALSGDIPSSIGSLHQLEYMYLNNNSFTGFIPSSISNLSTLKELYLPSNSFIGSIPVEIYNISSLEVLYLPFNFLSGSLPSFMCGHLQQIKIIELGHNMLSGPLPNTISECSQLRYLGVTFNNISGQIPREFWNMKMLEMAFFARNHLEGTVAKEVGNLTSLRKLNLGENRLTGTIPQEIGNLTKLEELTLDTNNMIGTIPEELRNLLNLESLVLGLNGLNGSVPTGIFNISTLIKLELDENYLSGSLQSTTGSQLPNLEFVSISFNKLSGVVPFFISNFSRLRYLDIHANNFGGIIPHSIGSLRALQYLSLAQNKFIRDPSSFELEFLTPLVNCNDLRHLDFSHNPLNGILPKSIGNLSKSVEYIFAVSSGISSEIPSSVGNLSNLFSLDLGDNQLTGSLPTSIASLKNLQYISLEVNQLSGSLSCNLLGMPGLTMLYLFENLFSGPIPECIGNSTSLRILSLMGNKFSSNIPMSLWNLKDIVDLSLSNNLLNGSLPSQVGSLKSVRQLYLSMNNLSGDIPDTIGDLQNLVNLSLSDNLFQGPIPDSIGRIISLENLYLSKNDLSGSIPTTLEKLQYLMSLNVSYNNLVGLIPSGGPFVNFTAESFLFNKALCGDKRFHVPSCPNISPRKLWIKGPMHILLLCLGLVALITSVTAAVLYLILRRKNMTHTGEELQLVTEKEQISFYDLQNATDRFDEKNLLGQGSFGSVYKATLKDGRVVAVKVFNSQVEGAFKSFDKECEKLRNLRHRNLTRVISSCSNLDFKALVLEFMPNGSLENWLHSANNFLSFTERLSIMIDVASALYYLHLGYPTPVVHADLKPNNVLLDESKVAHLSDFGIAKMMEESSITYTTTLATFGYIAPEYGSEGLVSTKCDVYSYGIMLMEVFTRKSPHDEMFNESLTLHDWVQNSIETALTEIIEDGLLNTPEDEKFALMIMNVALNCTKKFSRERCDIGEVLATLNKIKLRL